MARSILAIRREINDAQKQLTAAQNEKNMYNQSLSYSNKLMSSLKKCDASLNEANDNLKRYFTIDNRTADGGSIANSKESIDQIIRDLERNIIPHINSQINILTRQIRSLNSKIVRLKRELASTKE